MSLTLDFGPREAGQPRVLGLTGWTEYGTSSSNIALSQNSTVTVLWPLLEVETPGGEWVALDVVMGLPAGKTKTIIVDLEGMLPPGWKRLRLTTTHQVRWDRIALLEPRVVEEYPIRELKLDRADLGWRGFSEIRSRAKGHPRTPDYKNVSDRPRWDTALEGWYTRYGDVRRLIAAADGKLVLLNGGDELTAHFDAGDLPRLPRGMVRTFLLYSEGWNKEGDTNTVGGDRVEPLPGNDDTTLAGSEDLKDDWRLQYNTRWVPRHRFRPRSSQQ